MFTAAWDVVRWNPFWGALFANSLPIGRSHKTVVRVELGDIVLDCDILTIERADPHIVLNWAAPGTGAAEKRAVLRERVASAASLPSSARHRRRSPAGEA